MHITKKNILGSSTLESLDFLCCTSSIRYSWLLHWGWTLVRQCASCASYSSPITVGQCNRMHSHSVRRSCTNCVAGEDYWHCAIYGFISIEGENHKDPVSDPTQILHNINQPRQSAIQFVDSLVPTLDLTEQPNSASLNLQLEFVITQNSKGNKFWILIKASLSPIVRK